MRDAARHRRPTVGDRVEVDFDDEGWFKGIVTVAAVRDGARVYQVKLDDGEYADSVIGSEIRAERTTRSNEQSECSSCERVANTRSDALSGFDHASDACSERLSEGGAPEQELQMLCRVTDRGVDFKFIDDEQVTWSRPTISSLRAHDDKYPRWQAVKPGLC